jgi:hypothetical protein
VVGGRAVGSRRGLGVFSGRSARVA